MSVKLKSDTHWKDWVRRMRDAADVRPEVPSTLQTELRDYQLEGFHWLARLAAWGVGGCLADDMGLGKTIQAIALLLHRAGDGPALVVAPTSVAFNWLSEIQRFAPTLNVRIFGDGDRKAFLKDLGPRDVVICSYGLLHTEAETAPIASMAHRGPGRSPSDQEHGHAAIASGHGTGGRLPVDHDRHADGKPPGRIVEPVRVHQPRTARIAREFSRSLCRADRDAMAAARSRRRLKKLIQPFILRRTKSQVLQELPPRTEVTLQVELSNEEAAFYEALRQRAIEKLADVADGRSQHLQILAEIMRLRRACCHPRLVLDDCPIAGSKLALFSRRWTNCWTTITRSWSSASSSTTWRSCEMSWIASVSYQYLDGSTPARKRKQSVEAFQAGEGDVFLISLKAGGLGLNLTAADYVIHMDPWWNPAVEDQASDRAHRMGQQRPVTIYRFITQGTIEQRIMQLHASKRDLADSLLEGADMSGKLTAEELLRLIRD